MRYDERYDGRGRERGRGMPPYGGRRFYRDDEDEYKFGGSFWMDEPEDYDYEDEDDDEYYDEMRRKKFMRQGVKGTGHYGIGGRLHYPKRRRYRREDYDYPFDEAPFGEEGGELERIDKEISEILKIEDKDKKEIFKIWGEKMKNADGTKGLHFTKEQIQKMYNDERLKEKGISLEDFEITMNMMYSDYCKVLKDNGMSSQKMYIDLSIAFLKDEDAEKDKLLRYALFIAGIKPNKKEEA